LNNCIIYFNRAPGVRANCDSSCALNYCCTTPMPLYGVGNITNAPLFVDLAGGNLRLQSNSPCINAGWNTLAVGSTDLDGRPRIGGSRVYRVDIGAYEYQGAGMGEFIGWLQHYGLPTDGSVDFTDPDGDHYNNWQEWLAGSDPTDALSAPPFITAQPVSQVVAAGSTATFSVTATPAGSGLRYQWRYNGTNDLPGATNSSLMLPNAQPASDGLYSVLVSNVFGSILSSNVTLRVDHVPVADASATRSPVISANGINATVILDGSRSTDADQDLLQYEWLSTLNSQLSTPLASGVVATSVLPVGAHPILLVVSDGFFASTNPVTVEVITTAQAVERLLALVEVRGLRVQPLRASLEVALASIQRRNAHSAINQLEAFQNKVRSQVAGQAAVLAATLLAAAQAIIDALAPPNEREPGQPDVRITSLERGNGRMRMHIMGIPRRPCIIQASTNLVDWEMIRVATEHAGGEFQFEDAGIRRSRYYRVVFP
jgi:hypothetical protein